MLNTIVSHRRLHIAHDADYQGSVNSYNNWLTKSFSKLFRLSTDIKINNETRCVNKKSYLKLLPQLGVSVSEGTKTYKNFDQLTCTYLQDRGLMRHHISTKKSHRLGQAFIHAITAGNMQKATQLIGKGAQIDRHFWSLEGHGTCLEDRFVFHLEFDKSISPFKATQYTPLIYAVSKNNHELVKLLETYKANPGLLGRESKFERKITQVFPDQGWIGEDTFQNHKEISYDPVAKQLNFKDSNNQTYQWGVWRNGFRYQKTL